MLLEIKGMARSTFYYRLKALSKADKYEAVKKRICEIFKESKGRYSYRQVTMQLRNEGFGINHKTVEMLMSERGLKCLIRKKRNRSYKGTIGKIAPDVLNRDFQSGRTFPESRHGCIADIHRRSEKFPVPHFGPIQWRGAML